jgi:31-O-methyltransferase
MEIFQLNEYETPYLYEEIFERREYAPDWMSIPAGGVVVDVGANIGMFSVFAMLEWQPSRLIAVEPVPELQEILRLNLGSWPEARVAPVAVGSERGTTSFTYYPGCSVFSGRFCDADRELAIAKAQSVWEEAGSMTERELEVYASALDELLKPLFVPVQQQAEMRTISELIDEYKLDQIDLLKIDAEGSELEVIEGIEATDWPRIRNIAMETDEHQVSVGGITALIESQQMKCEIRQHDLYREIGMHLIFAQAGS